MRLFSSIITLTILTLILPVAGQNLQISISPQIGGLSLTSDQLSGYYDAGSIFAMGGEINVMTDLYNLGVYFNLLNTNITIDDPNEIGGPITEEAIITSLGLVKRFDLEILSLDIKAGLSLHSDKLQLGNDDLRIGFRIGTEISKNLSGPLSALVGVAYDHNRLSVPSYETFAYSRHCSYLSGQELNTGGFLYYAGFTYNFSL